MRDWNVKVESLEVRRFLSVGLAAPGQAADSPHAVVVSAPASGATSKPSEGGVTLGEYAGVRFTARLGEFHFKTVDQLLNAVIDWGDGKHSNGTIVGSYASGDWYVKGTHTYAHTGSYDVAIKVYARPAGAPTRPTDPVAQIKSVVNVKTLRPSPGGVSLTERAGKEFTAKLGEFTKKVVDLALDAVITWGDGTKSGGKLVGSYATGEYYVEGTHTYKQPGTYKVDVKIYAHPVGSPILPTSPVARFTSVIKAVS